MLSDSTPGRAATAPEGAGGDLRSAIPVQDPNETIRDIRSTAPRRQGAAAKDALPMRVAEAVPDDNETGGPAPPCWPMGRMRQRNPGCAGEHRRTPHGPDPRSMPPANQWPDPNAP